MKKVVKILLLTLVTQVSIAQNWNPYVTAGSVSPAPIPMSLVAAPGCALNGTANLQFTVGNTGNDPLSQFGAQPLVINIGLSYGVPNDADPIAALTGTFKSRFSWVYNSAIKTYTGTQIANILGLENGSLIIAYKVTTESLLPTALCGFNVNLTPPAYTNGSNSQPDDNVSAYTYTTRPAPKVLLYEVPCFVSNADFTLTARVANAVCGVWYQWQYKTPTGNWEYFNNGLNLINGGLFTISNPKFQSNAISYDASGASLSPALGIARFGAQTNDVLHNVQVRLLMTTNGLSPDATTPANTYGGGPGYLNPGDAKTYRLSVAPCFCATNTLVMPAKSTVPFNNPNVLNPTLDIFYGGFERQPATTGNFFAKGTPIDTTAAQTDLTLWTGGASTNKYMILNNPDSMQSGFTIFAPHMGRAMMVVNANNSCTQRVWYRTLMIDPTLPTKYFAGPAPLTFWATKVNGGANPTFVIEIKGALTATSNVYVTLGTITQTVSAAAGTWQLIQSSVTVPPLLYKKLQYSITETSGCVTPVSFAIDDICALEPGISGLPITLLSFTATKLTNTVRLNWETSQEVNSKHFDVEYSKDGVNWQSIGIVNAAGNSATARSYSFIHNSPVIGVNYYRLKLVDIDASFKNSPTRTVTFGGKNTITILPNPTTDKLFISSTTGGNLQSIALYTADGKLLQTINNFILGSSIEMYSYPRGIYMLKIVEEDGSTQTMKVVKQ